MKPWFTLHFHPDGMDRSRLQPTMSVNLGSLAHTSPSHPIKAASVWHTLGYPWLALTMGPAISPR